MAVLLNAIVSPVLGAMSDRVRRRKPYLLVFTIALRRADGDHRLRRHSRSASSRSRSRTSAYQAALIYYDSLLPTSRDRSLAAACRGSASALGYCGSIVVGRPCRASRPWTTARRPRPFVLVASLFAVFAGPDLRRRPRARARRGTVSARRGARLVSADRETVRRRAASRAAAIHRRALLLHRPGEHGDRRHEPVRHQRGRVHGGRGAAACSSS